MSLANAAAGFCVLATSLQVVGCAIAAMRCRARTRPLPPPHDAPSVTIVRPVCGVDNFARETLGSTFGLDYPNYAVIFCAAREDDPVVALVRELIAAHPQAPARLLIGDDRVGPNPKLNNVVKGFDAARGEWQIMADSNVLMPRDYIQRLLARWRPDSGCVVSVPIASRPANFWAELECAFLNTFQARWEYVSDTLGFGFAQGKNMLFRRDLLAAIGGVRALGAAVAEDAATTKAMRGIGKRVHLMDGPFEQPLARRGAGEVWARQLRWARLRRITFPLLYAPEILTGCAFPLLAGIYGAAANAMSVTLVAALILAIWVAAEAALARCAGWHLSWRLPLAMLIRDVMLPPLFVAAWLGDEVHWRGSTVKTADERSVIRRWVSTASPACGAAVIRYAFARRLTSRRRLRSPGR
ncbi:MAG TPA: ceramide glucosyltransferase [Stellaceae bacterium]|nr:ceramide glucosyltransferase [Stellaceae bacterium]